MTPNHLNNNVSNPTNGDAGRSGGGAGNPAVGAAARVPGVTALPAADATPRGRGQERWGAGLGGPVERLGTSRLTFEMEMEGLTRLDKDIISDRLFFSINMKLVPT